MNKRRLKGHKSQHFYSTKSEVDALLHGAKAIPSALKQLAFLDEEFLLSPEIRSVRLLLEFLKCEIQQKKNHIHKIITIFGSAKIIDPFLANCRVTELQNKLKAAPHNISLQNSMEAAQISLKNSVYYEKARHFAAMLSEIRIDGDAVTIATGGGPGIMEAANRGAQESGHRSIGMSILLPTEQITNYYVDANLNFYFHYFALRKMHMLRNCQASVFFPGGFGTLDELFEVLTLISTQKMKPMPIVLLGKEFWSSIINFEALLKQGMIQKSDLKLFKILDSVESAWRYINSFYNGH